MKIFYRFIKVFVVLVISVVALRYYIIWNVFWPTRDILWTPDIGGYDYENVFITTRDGVKINGWYINCDNSRGTVLYFHGNGGNISYGSDTIRIFNSLGMSVFTIDYRGYGESEGSPSIKGVNRDALAAWNWLISEKVIPSDQILVFGRSLGGAVAVELMRTARPEAAILESTFSALADVAGLYLSPIVNLLVGGAWNSAKTASQIDIPTLCIHSPDDEIVPYELGRRLYEALAGEKYFFEIKGDHNYGFLLSGPGYKERLDNFLTEHFGEHEFSNIESDVK